MTLPPKLARELEALSGSHQIEVIEDPDFVNLIFKSFALGDGYSVSTSDMLMRIPRSYPDGGPDMFWVGKEVLLASGAVPQAADSIEPHLGREWRRFSWHRPGNRWHPTADNIQSQLEFIRRRLIEEK
jgi:hypothetical protein